MFRPATATSCLVSASLVQERQDHSQEGLLLCGGSEALTSCEEFSPATGTWARTSHNLQERRGAHVSWSVEEGTQLMGGEYSGTTSEIVKHDGTTETSFDMKYDTRYETIQYSFYFIFTIPIFYPLHNIIYMCIAGMLAPSRTPPPPRCW